MENLLLVAFPEYSGVNRDYLIEPILCLGATLQSVIQNQDITVVVQGPVQSIPDRAQEVGITQKCLQSVRRWLPGARLILSTWEGQDLSGLDYDELVLNDDPGSNIVSYDGDGAPRRLNHNRQIVSTRNGLCRVKTPYAIKLRSDNYLTSDHFKELQGRFKSRSDEYRLFEERILIINTFTRKYGKGFRVLFHPSDFFHFGRTSDLQKLWDIPLFEDLSPSPDHVAAGLPYYRGIPRYECDPTQEIFLRFLSQHVDVSLRHLHDQDPIRRKISEKVFANNFVIAAPEAVGVGLGMKFTHKVRIAKKKGRAGFYTLSEWQSLYRRFCDPSFSSEANVITWAENMFYRLAGVHLRKPETAVNLFKLGVKYRKLQH